MKREMVLSNGKFFVNIDSNITLRDYYFPYVGMYNHLNSNPVSMGLWIDDKFNWINGDWKIKFSYKDKKLIGLIEAYHPDNLVKLNLTLGIHKYLNILMYKIDITNLENVERKYRLCFYHSFNINESDIGNTSYYDPKLKGLVHYKGQTYIFISSEGDNFTYTVSKRNHEYGSWKEIEEGKLKRTKIIQGEIDSGWCIEGHLNPSEKKTVFYYHIVGKNYEEVRKIKERVEQEGLDHLLEETEDFWNFWINTKKALVSPIPVDIKNLYHLSLLITRAHFDNSGAVVAANDTSIYKFNKDHYSYLWPRDGAFICIPLDNAGYTNLTKNFFKFCKKHITEEGFLLHKYSPDGTAGSSWHPWSDEEENYQLPIQEDETSLVIVALYNHYLNSKDIEFVDYMYNGFVKKASDFLCRFIDPKTNLPLPSYDLWEERRGVFTYTAATVYGGLVSASNLARLVGNRGESLRYREVAENIRESILRFMYDEESKRFIRGLYIDKNGDLIKDRMVESSLLLLHEFGIISPDDYRMENTVKAIEETLYIREGIGGLARYENDYYHRVSDRFVGNPWIITTLWLANWYIEIDRIDKGLELLNWVTKRRTQAGLLAEQYNPITGEPVSVCPLTWSHASFVYSVQKLNKKMQSD